MDSLEIEGKEYISAKRAAREHSYTMDYIGQLIRGGKLIGKKVGRAWYVEQDSLNAYLALLLKPQDAGMAATIEASQTSPVVQEPVAEKSADTGVEVQNPSVPASVATQVAQVVHREPERPAYHYPMLNYVQEDQKEEELIPHLDTSAAAEKPIAITRTYQQETPHEEVYEAGPQQQQMYAQVPQGWQERQVGKRRSYLPSIRVSVLPAALGATALLLLVSAVGASVFLVKEVSYQGATASISESIKYVSIFKESR